MLTQTRHVFILILLLVLFDILAINCAYAALCFIYNHFSTANLFNLPFIILINVSWLVMAIVNKLYNYTSVQTINKVFYKSLLTYSCQVLLINLVATHFLKMSGEFISYFLIMVMFCLTVIRQCISFAQKRYDGLIHYRKKIAIVGNSQASESLADFFKQNGLSYSFAGHYTNVSKDNVEDHLTVLKRKIQYAIDNKLDEVYTSLFPEDCKGLVPIIKMAEQSCIRVKFVTSNANYKATMANLPGSVYNVSTYYNGIPILVHRPEPLNMVRNRAIKRAFDIVFSLGVLALILSWLIPLMAIIIKLESRGPVFFMQLRSGRNNKPFWCYKFRSMCVNAQSNNMQAVKNDARITKVGAFIRKTSLDELPQFINVLLGNMSIVGPRPHMLKHTDQYKEIIDQYMVRLYLKPGITGWAQINGHRGETQNPEQMRNRVEHDIWYMENWSIWADMRIIYQTVVNALRGEENAY